MKKLIIGFIVGFIFATAGSVYADKGLQKVEAYLRPTLPITLDGNPVTLESSPIMYDGSTYLKLRDVAGLTGLQVNWNDAAQTVELGKGVTPVDSTITTPTETTYEGIKAVSINGETYFSLKEHSQKTYPLAWGFNQEKNTLFYAEFVKGSTEIVRVIKEVNKGEPNANLVYKGETYLNVIYYPQP